MSSDTDDPFWNDGAFTNTNEPWAVDPITQDGMRLVARLARGKEEVHRIGREVRRTMRWAVVEHGRILPLIFGLRLPSQLEWATQQLSQVLNNPILVSLTTTNRLDAIRAILHNQFIKLSSLQLRWNMKLLPILNSTGPYNDDSHLLSDWNQQIL